MNFCLLVCLFELGVKMKQKQVKKVGETIPLDTQKIFYIWFIKDYAINKRAILMIWEVQCHDICKWR